MQGRDGVGDGSPPPSFCDLLFQPLTLKWGVCFPFPNLQHCYLFISLHMVLAMAFLLDSSLFLLSKMRKTVGSWEERNGSLQGSGVCIWVFCPGCGGGVGVESRASCLLGKCSTT
jgi:hypothetical protein